MENSILDYLKSNNAELFEKITLALQKGKQVNFTDINQSDVFVLTPQKAFEYGGEEGDKYFKVWMAGNVIAWCTWANSMVDSNFRWNAKAKGENKRDNSDILGNEPYVSAYLKSNEAIAQCSTVYMFPFEAFQKKEKVNIEKTETKKVVEKKTLEEQQLGKRAQQEREKRLSEQDELMNEKIDWLSVLSTAIEKNLSIVREMVRANQSQRKEFSRKKNIGDYESEIRQNISQLESTVVELSVFGDSKFSEISSHYKQKVSEYKNAMDDLEPQVRNAALASKGAWEEVKKSFASSFSTAESAEVKNIIFNNDINQIIPALHKLCSIINDTDANDNERGYDAAIGKFDSGLSLLKSVDPTNEMIPYFEGRLQKWKKKKKNEKILIMCIGCICFLYLFIMAILEKLGLAS